MKKLFFASLAALVLCANVAFARVGLLQFAAPISGNVYVSSAGSDSNPGTQALPWLTLANVNSRKFLSSACVNLNGGNTFGGGTTGISSATLTCVTSYGTGQATMANSAPAVIASNQSYADPCASPGIAKSSVPINISSATTTSIVSLSGSTAVYVCGGVLNIAGSATSANTAKFIYGAGSTCATTPTALTGTFGSNDAAVAPTPDVVPLGYGNGTAMTAPSGNGLCLLTAGTSPFVQGFLSYVQQ